MFINVEKLDKLEDDPGCEGPSADGKDRCGAPTLVLIEARVGFSFGRASMLVDEYCEKHARELLDNLQGALR